MLYCSLCGLDCDNCSYKKELNCVTCRVGLGTVCHGRCDVALCVIKRKLDECSCCPEYPCKRFFATRAY